MCPMIKEGDPPVSYDLLEEARRNLDRDHGFALGEEDGRTVLLVRVPESKPNPFHACEVVSFGVAQDDLVAVKDVFLIGDDRVVRVEPSTLEDLVEERLEEDPQVAQHLRNRLDRGYDYTVFRHKGARDHLRLGVRVPRERVDTLSDEDREGLAEVLSPILSSPKGRKIRAYYLVGDEHARRLARDELVDLVGPALEDAVAEQPDPAPPEGEDEPDLETEPPQGADTLDAPESAGGAPSPGTASPGEADDAGAELLGSEGSTGDPTPGASAGTADEDPSDPSPSPASGHGGAPSGTGGGGEDLGGPGLGDPDPASADPDDTGAEFLGAGPSDEEEEASEPSPDPSEAPDAGPDPRESQDPAPPETPTEPPAGGSEPSPPSGATEGSSSGGADRPSPDDEGVAGLAGRAGQVDRPDPDEAPAPDEASEGGDDLIVADGEEPPEGDPDAVTAEVDQVPGGDVPSPATSEEAAASRAEAFAEGSEAGSAEPSTEDRASPAPDAGAATPAPEPGEPAATPEDPAPVAAHRLAEAGYEVVEDVEAGGQPFDFAADRSGGKRLLGLAVPSLDPNDVEALAEAGREAGADAVLAIPLETERGAREASWGTVVDLVPPEAAASLEL